MGDFAPAVAAGADAVLAASVFHFRELTIGEVKAAMSAAEGCGPMSAAKRTNQVWSDERSEEDESGWSR